MFKDIQNFLLSIDKPGKFKIKFKNKFSFIKFVNLINFLKLEKFELTDIYIKKNKIIFNLKEKEIIKVEEKDLFILDISKILDLSYEEAFLLKDFIKEFYETSQEKEIEISDSLINSVAYILKQKFNKVFDKVLVFDFIHFILNKQN